MPFISKFALTSGILEVPDIAIETNGSYWHNSSGRAGWGTYVSSIHVHGTREKAVARGEKMRSARIASHEKSIVILHKIKL